jgi:hypothetical protein
MLHLFTNLTRVVLFAFYLFLTYKCLSKPPEKKPTSCGAAYSQFIAGNPKTISARPNARMGAAALDQLGQPASRKEKSLR